MALFLDFDGTLVELAARPEAVTVAPAVIAVLRRLQEDLQGAVAVVSGRSIAQIDGFLAPLHLPAAGLHGLEHRETVDTDIVRQPESPGIRRLKTLVHQSGLLERGIYCEDKGQTLALHYRAHPALEAELQAFVSDALSGLPSLHEVAGKMVIEIKPHGTDKGVALRHFMAHAPFAGRHPVFIGDDVTDEDGIAAAQAMGGTGIKVGSGASCAGYRLPDVAAVLSWLEQGSFVDV